jgi:hypothetical protein
MAAHRRVAQKIAQLEGRLQQTPLTDKSFASIIQSFIVGKERTKEEFSVYPRTFLILIPRRNRFSIEGTVEKW